MFLVFRDRGNNAVSRPFAVLNREGCYETTHDSLELLSLDTERAPHEIKNLNGISKLMVLQTFQFWTKKYIRRSGVKFIGVPRE